MGYNEHGFAFTNFSTPGTGFFSHQTVQDYDVCLCVRACGFRLLTTNFAYMTILLPGQVLSTVNGT